MITLALQRPKILMLSYPTILLFACRGNLRYYQSGFEPLGPVGKANNQQYVAPARQNAWSHFLALDS